MNNEYLSNLHIRPAHPNDLGRLMQIFDIARQFMETTGNERQWINGYPQRELISSEIESGHCYVCTDTNRRILATFCFIEGPDQSYARIEDGKWLDDAPYHVIHRIASSGETKGIFRTCLDWCAERSCNLRIDTHADNLVMQHLAESNGFIRCGIIYVSNGTPRIAYQRHLK